MSLKKFGMLFVIAASLTACGTPAKLIEAEPTLPPPAVATEVPTSLPPAESQQATSLPTVQATQAMADPPTEMPTQPAIQIISGAFVDMEVPVTGAFTLDPSASLIRFSADFNVDPGPDLYVILSGAHDLALDFPTFSEKVVETPILYLGPLANHSGAQAYAVPDGTDLAPFNTVVIWCKRYSVAFAAAALK